MELIIIIICSILCVLVGIIFYKIGRKKTVNIVQENNDNVLREREQILQDISRISSNYEAQKALINNARQNAQTAYNEKSKALEQEYAYKKEEFERTLASQKDLLYNDFEEFKTKINAESKQLQNELEQYQAQKQAIVEATHREEILQKEKDNYRLVLTSAEHADIQTLESIRHVLRKPRILSMLIWQTFYQPKAKKLFANILGTEAVTGIYKITNIQTDECYIGQSLNCRERFLQHCKCGLGIDTPEKNKLYEAMLKYGLDQFTFEVIQECNKEELNELEQFYIKTYLSCDYGYNSNTGVK